MLVASLAGDTCYEHGIRLQFYDARRYRTSRAAPITVARHIGYPSYLKGVYQMSVPFHSVRTLADQPPTAPFSLPIPMVYERDPQRAQWEYRVVSVDLREEPPLDDERLASLGAEGWLLAGAIQPPSAREAAHTIIYYFVRQA